MDFKFRKRDNCFIWHENGIGSMIELDHWIRDNMLTIYPIYMVRFDILKNGLRRIVSRRCGTNEIIHRLALAVICLKDRTNLFLRSPLLIRNIVNYVTLSRSVLR